MGSEGTENRGKLWGIAAVVGVLAFLALKLFAGYAFWQALLLAILIGVLVAILLWIGFYRDAEETTDAANAPAQSKSTSSADTAAVTAKLTAEPAKNTSEKVKPKPETQSKPSATKGSAKKPASKASPVAKDGQPPLLKNPRSGGADDLKQIDGVGPVLEKTLNELGIFHFDQIAAWRKKEIDWVDARLKVKGRIVRDGWVKQCKSLAKT